MNRYMKKWHFKVPFEWVDEDGITIKACFKAFVNTIHECATPADMPQEIPDFTFTIWTEGDELGWHGHFSNPYSGEKEDVGLCGSMYLVSTDKKDANGNSVFIRRDELKHTKENWAFNGTVIYGFPKFEQKITNADIYSTEYLVLSDGWQRLGEEDRIAEIKEALQNAKNMIDTIVWINNRDFSRNQGEESCEILNNIAKSKLDAIVEQIFGKPADALNNFKHDFDEAKDYYYALYSYVSNYYVKVD